MAGLEADVSSYNQPLPVSPLETAGKVGQLQQQKLQIDKSKLDLINTQFGLMNQELSAMSDDPTITKPQAAERLNRFATTLKLPPEAVNHMMEELNAAPSVKVFSDNALRRGMTVQEKLNQQYGTPGQLNDQGFVYPGVTAPAAKGGGFTTSGTRFPVQQPPGVKYYDEANQERYTPAAGPSGPQANPAAMSPDGAPSPRPLPVGGSVAPPAPRQRALPVEPPPAPVSGPTGPTVDRTAETPTTLANRLEPLKAGPSPLFPEGKESYTKDQLAASARTQAIKPAVQALRLMPGLATGPITGKINELVAGAKALGFVDTKAENDPTVLRQEVEKKLAQYVGSSPIGQRSDAQQALAEAGSPNPKVQILPALMNLTRDAIALDRVKILQPQAFTGNNYENYIKHQGTFPQGIDEKALTLDMLPEEERNKLVEKMVRQYEKGNASEKKIANRFLDTLKLAAKHGIYEGM